MVLGHRPAYYRTVFGRHYLSSEMVIMSHILKTRFHGEKTITIVSFSGLKHTFTTLIAMRFCSIYQPYFCNRPVLYGMNNFRAECMLNRPQHRVVDAGDMAAIKRDKYLRIIASYGRCTVIIGPAVLALVKPIPSTFIIWLTRMPSRSILYRYVDDLANLSIG